MDVEPGHLAVGLTARIAPPVIAVVPIVTVTSARQYAANSGHAHPSTVATVARLRQLK